MESPESQPPRRPKLAPDTSPPPPPEPDPERVRYGFKRADVAPVNTGAEAPVDVHEILDVNARARAERETEKPILPPPISRRALDYWTVMIPVNLIAGILLYVFRHNVVILLFGGSGLIFFDIGLTWLTWMVMSRD